MGVLSGELVEHVRGHGEAGGEAVEHGVMEEVLHEYRLADAVGSDEDAVGGVVDEGEGEELFDEGWVDAFGPVEVEVGDGFEGSDAGVGEAAFEGAALAFAVFDVDDALDPGLGEHGVVLHGETVEYGVVQALAHGVGVLRGCLVHRGRGRSRMGR